MNPLKLFARAVSAVARFARGPDFLAEYEPRRMTGVETVQDGARSARFDFDRAELAFSAVELKLGGRRKNVWTIEETSFYRSPEGAIVVVRVPGTVSVATEASAAGEIDELRKAADATKRERGLVDGRTLVKVDKAAGGPGVSGEGKRGEMKAKLILELEGKSHDPKTKDIAICTGENYIAARTDDRNSFDIQPKGSANG